LTKNARLVIDRQQKTGIDNAGLNNDQGSLSNARTGAMLKQKLYHISFTLPLGLRKLW